MTDATEMLTIDAFVEARLREDEETARAAIDPDRPGTHWRWEDGERDPLQPGDEPEELDALAISLCTVEEYPTRFVGPLPAFILHQVEARLPGGLWHIARHDPARVLRQCAALRDVLESLKTAADAWASLVAEHGDPRTEPDFVQWLGPLASIWSSHPDFRAEWSA